MVSDADKALDPKNRETLLHFLKNDSTEKKKLKEALGFMDKAREMFNYIPKLDEHGDLTSEVPGQDVFKSVIKDYHDTLYRAFPWAACSSSQHDIVDHIADDIGMIGEMSAQGVESQHHLWRYFLINNSFKGNPQLRLDNSLENQYVLTDDEIVEELKIIPTEIHHCGNCLEAGHNVLSCKAPCGKCGSFLHKVNTCQTAVFSSDMVLHSTL